MYTNNKCDFNYCLSLVFDMDKEKIREVMKDNKLRFTTTVISEQEGLWKADIELIYSKEKGFYADHVVKQDIQQAIDVFNEYSQLVNKVEKYLNSYYTTNHLYIISNLFVTLEIDFKEREIKEIRFLVNHHYALNSTRFDFDGDFNDINGIKGNEQFKQYLGSEGKIDSVEIYQNNQLSGGIFSSLIPLFEQTFNLEKDDMSISHFLTLVEMSEI